MHKQQSDTDQIRADPAAGTQEMLKGPGRNRTSGSLKQIKTKPLLIINSSQGAVENGKIPRDLFCFGKQSKRGSFYCFTRVIISKDVLYAQ